MKRKVILGSIVILIVAIISMLGIIYVLRKDNGQQPLYEDSYENNAWGYVNYGYTIYENGLIKQYDNSKEKRIQELKEAVLTKDELSKMKEFANKIEDKFEVDDSSMIVFDAGLTIRKIYNKKLGKWITLSESRNR